MTLLKYTYWQDGEMWLGYLEEYPDYMTQGKNMEELQENLKDIYQELVSGVIPSGKFWGGKFWKFWGGNSGGNSGDKILGTQY